MYGWLSATAGSAATASSGGPLLLAVADLDGDSAVLSPAPAPPLADRAAAADPAASAVDPADPAAALEAERARRAADRAASRARPALLRAAHAWGQEAGRPFAPSSLSAGGERETDSAAAFEASAAAARLRTAFAAVAGGT